MIAINQVSSLRDGVVQYFEASRLIRVVAYLVLFVGSQSIYAAGTTTIIFQPELWAQADQRAVLDPVEEARIDQLIAQMTLEEKVGQMTQVEIKFSKPADLTKYHIGSVLNGGGSWPNNNAMSRPEDWIELADEYYAASTSKKKGRLGIPVIWGTDGVHGHNNVVGATLFPHNIGLGAGNNPELVTAIGRATAIEIAATGIDWNFAPTLAVARDDRWGRTYESYSEDPQIVASLGDALVIGLQGADLSELRDDPATVVATAKHFVGDGGTLAGDDQGDTFTSERTLAERHALGYVTTLNNDVQTVMASYSSWRGYKLHGNEYLLTTILKQRMGFDGFVIGDWNAHEQLDGCSKESCSLAINAGVDMIMVPEDWRGFIRNTLRQVRSGEIAQSRVDDAVRRILRVKLRAGLLDQRSLPRPDVSWIGHPQHRAIARQAARESLVLLKNAADILPLDPNSKVFVTGDGADNLEMQTGGWTVSWQGTDNKPEHYRGSTSILQGIKAEVASHGGEVVFSASGEAPKDADVAIVIFGETPYVEMKGDREHLVFSRFNSRPLRQLAALRKQGIPTVVVFLSGRPMVVSDEIELAEAFIAAWLPGSEGAAIADALFARDGFNFKGTLPFSWPHTEQQKVLNFDDEFYMPKYPLGYGLRTRLKRSH